MREGIESGSKKECRGRSKRRSKITDSMKRRRRRISWQESLLGWSLDLEISDGRGRNTRVSLGINISIIKRSAKNVSSQEDWITPSLLQAKPWSASSSCLCSSSSLSPVNHFVSPRDCDTDCIQNAKERETHMHEGYSCIPCKGWQFMCHLLIPANQEEEEEEVTQEVKRSRLMDRQLPALNSKESQEINDGSFSAKTSFNSIQGYKKEANVTKGQSVTWILMQVSERW